MVKAAGRDILLIERFDRIYTDEGWSRKSMVSALGSISPATAATYRDTRLEAVSAYPVHQELALLSHLFTKAKKRMGYSC